MHRFYCPDLKIELSRDGLSDAAALPRAASLPLPEAESRHALKVLRLRNGEQVEVFNGRGVVGEARLHVTSSQRAWVTPLAVRELPLSRPYLAVASAFPKGPRLDWMVDQLSQLGADLLIPVHTRYSVVNPRQAKLDRLRRAAIESAKQCGRAWIMAISEPRDLADLLIQQQWTDSTPRSIAPLRLMANASGQPLPHETVRQVTGIEVLIGPEGGWHESEEALALARGFRPWRLGSNILRIETAAAAAAAILRAAALA